MGKEIKMDLLTFLCLENFSVKLNIASFGPKSTIDETTAKTVLKDFGMNNLPDSVLDIAGSGMDTLRRRQFHSLELTKNAIIVEAVAAEQRRTKNNIKLNKLKVNKDDSRLYPEGPRRFMSSP